MNNSVCGIHQVGARRVITFRMFSAFQVQYAPDILHYVPACLLLYGLPLYWVFQLAPLIALDYWLKVCFTALCCLVPIVFVSHHLLVLCDPGIVRAEPSHENAHGGSIVIEIPNATLLPNHVEPPNVENLTTDTVDKKNIELENTSLRNQNEEVSHTYCPTCHIVRPPRSSHCATCDVCIHDFDHHCGFLGSCIGRSTILYFYAFVLATTLLSWAMFLSILHIGMRQRILRVVHGVIPSRFQGLKLIGLGLISGTVAVVISALCVYYTHLLCSNRTFKEEYKKFRSRSEVHARDSNNIEVQHMCCTHNIITRRWCA